MPETQESGKISTISGVLRSPESLMQDRMDLGAFDSSGQRWSNCGFGETIG
jgi:hypothetical protein